jgi:putative ABC transport system ATP-binding protein
MQTNREFGTTTAIITHNAPIQALANRVLRFSDGRISEVTENTRRVAPRDIHW